MKYTPRVLVNYVCFTFLFAVSVIFLARTAISDIDIDGELKSAVADAEAPIQIMIDPGHGGEDGGASYDDLIEKELNLDVSMCLYDIYTVFGYNSALTRSEDTLLYDRYNDLENYRGKKKSYDLKNRLRLAEESGASLFVGIHMNKFPEEQYKGLQTYYSPNCDGSKNAATLIQTYAKNYLPIKNTRTIKKATDSIYILRRIEIPAVLVECGFLSNREERELLATAEYKAKLAAVIFASTAEYMVAAN